MRDPDARRRFRVLPGGAEERRGRPRLALALLQISVSLALLWLLLRQVDFGHLLTLLGRSLDNAGWLVAAAVLVGLGILVATLRWRLLLRGQRHDPPFGTLLRAFLVGVFFNQFLPSTLGGDVARAMWIARDGPPRATSLVVVALDRWLGMLGICLAALLGLAFHPPTSDEAPLLAALTCLALLAVMSGLALAHPGARRWARRMLRGPLRGLRRRSTELFDALAVYRKQKLRLAACAGLSVLIQVLIAFAYASIARSMEVGPGFVALAAIVPVVSLVSAFPVTINGIGARENALALLSGGLVAGAAVGIAWLFMLCGLLYGAAGGVLYVIASARRAGIGRLIRRGESAAAR
ncbi:MAG: flippase-like domain-containing protein [Acidobacteria bacterium]|nr:flippase-like domain-containing protein [Acidobacteriota bacterium]